MEVGGKKVKSPMKVSSKAGLLYVNDRQYKGEIMVHAGIGGLLIVDVLPLETYLTGLINAEVNSSWPREAIRAQAVAARSYALIRAHQSASRSFARNK